MPSHVAPVLLSRRQLLLTAALGGAALLVGSVVTGTYRFRVVRVGLSLAGLNEPLRAVWLTDLHVGPFIREGSVAAWIDAALQQQADVLLLGGDLVDQEAARNLEPLLRQLQRLSAPLGTYAVWGNHDHKRFPDLTAFAASLRGVGVEVLVNRGVALRDDVYLAGIDDLLLGRPDLGAALAGQPAGSATLLMSHNPDVLPTVPETVGLTLCGHTHGGQVCLPGFGPLITNSRYGRRFVHGIVRAPALGYTSRGLGVTALPIRVDCPAELTVFDLLPEGRPDPGAPSFAAATG